MRLCIQLKISFPFYVQWVVVVVEVRPNLLSSDFERFPLKEIVLVGDVILVEDENVSEGDFKLVGLETLVRPVLPSLQVCRRLSTYFYRNYLQDL